MRRSNSLLASSQLFDCNGRVTHTLTVLPEGVVEVRTAACTCVVDPRTRSVHPPSVHLHDEVIDHAATMLRDLGG